MSGKHQKEANSSCSWTLPSSTLQARQDEALGHFREPDFLATWSYQYPIPKINVKVVNARHNESRQNLQLMFDL